jgi:Amt family ammonium transporter
VRELTLGYNSIAARFGVLSLLCAAFSAPAFADMGTSAGDTAWILTATALVLFMTLPGLALFYGGLVQAKNLLSVLMQCMAIAALMSIVWLVCGYSLAFGPGEAASSAALRNPLPQASPPPRWTGSPFPSRSS